MDDAWKQFNDAMRETIEDNILKYKRTNKRRPWVTIHSGHFYSAPSSPLLLRGVQCKVQKKRRANNKALEEISEVEGECNKWTRV